MRRGSEVALAIALLAGCGGARSPVTTTPGADRTPATTPGPPVANPPGPLVVSGALAQPGPARTLLDRLHGCLRAASERRWAEAGACYREDATLETVGREDAPLVGREEIVQGRLQAGANAFADLRSEPQITLLDAARSRALVLSLVRGTQSGYLGKMPPSRRSIATFSALWLDLDVDGLIAHARVYADRGTLFAQLGLGTARHRGADTPPLAAPLASAGVEAAEEAARLAVPAALAQLLTGGDAASAAMLYREDAILHELTLPGDLSTRTEIAAHLSALAAASSTRVLRIEQAFVAGDWVALETTLAGVNDGPLPWFPGRKGKTGKPISQRRLELIRLDQERIAEHWVLHDAYSLAVALGYATAPKPAAAPPAEPAPQSPAASENR